MNKRTKNILIFSLLLLFIAGLIVLLLFMSPAHIVETLGATNGYLATLIISFFGGFSALGSATFISTLITFSAGGLNPLYLGLIAGTALALGDMIMFYLGSRGRELVRGKWEEELLAIERVFEEKTWLSKTTPIIAYLYIGFVPLPNDILLLFLAAIEFPRKYMYPIIILGDLTFALTLSYLGGSALSFIF